VEGDATLATNVQRDATGVPDQKALLSGSHFWRDRLALHFINQNFLALVLKVKVKITQD